MDIISIFLWAIVIAGYIYISNNELVKAKECRKRIGEKVTICDMELTIVEYTHSKDTYTLNNGLTIKSDYEPK